METVKFDQDITVLYVTAASFPDGIQGAHETLHARVPFSAERRYFGVSRPENGAIVYRAAAEALQPGEADQYNCGTLVLPKGNYVGMTIEGYRKAPQKIGETFDELLARPDIDPEGYCVEWYDNEQDVMKCLVRLAE